MDAAIRSRPATSAWDARALRERAEDEARREGARQLEREAAQRRLNARLSRASPRAGDAGAFFSADEGGAAGATTTTTGDAARAAAVARGRARNLREGDPPFGTLTDAEIAFEGYASASRARGDDAAAVLGAVGRDVPAAPFGTLTEREVRYVAPAPHPPSEPPSNPTALEAWRMKRAQLQSVGVADALRGEEAGVAPPPALPSSAAVSRALSALRTRRARDAEGTGAGQALGHAADAPAAARTGGGGDGGGGARRAASEYASATFEADAARREAASLERLLALARSREEAERSARETEVATERARADEVTREAVARFKDADAGRRRKMEQQRQLLAESEQYARERDERLRALERERSEGLRRELDALERRREAEKAEAARRTEGFAKRRASASAAAAAAVDEEDARSDPYRSALREASRRVLKAHERELELVEPVVRRLLVEPEFAAPAVAPHP